MPQTCVEGAMDPPVLFVSRIGFQRLTSDCRVVRQQYAFDLLERTIPDEMLTLRMRPHPALNNHPAQSGVSVLSIRNGY